MASRPAHLTAENAARFQDQTVVDAYPLRLPYPPLLFDRLIDLIRDTPRAVLDVGTGTGELARPLAPSVDRIDAVDASAAMIAKGRSRPGGDHPNLRWVAGRVEDVPLRPPYALITAGDSLHWMDWEVVMPRFREVSSPRGLLAIVHRTELPPPWQSGLSRLISQYSTMPNFEPFDLIDLLKQRGLFEPIGQYEAEPIWFSQSIEAYVASFHSRSSLSLENMAPAAALEFDQHLRDLVRPSSEDGMVRLQIVGSIVWGRPGSQ